MRTEKNRTKSAIQGNRSSGQLQVVQKNRTKKNGTGVFISRLSPQTKTHDIETYIHDLASSNVKVEKINTKFDTYSSFVIKCEHETRVKLLKPDVWEEGILIRGYYESTVTNSLTN